MGPSREDATERGSRIGRLGKVLLRGDTGGVVVWGGDLIVVGANGAEARWSSCGVPETGDEVKGEILKDGLWREVAAEIWL